MAKRAPRRSARNIRLSEAQLRQPGLERAAAVDTEAPVAAAAHVSDLAQEYRYVTADLRRIAIIAAVMLAVLITLALALP